MKCEYSNCSRKAKYFMGWLGNSEKKFGYICPTHDKMLGRKNLMAVGMTLKEAIAFDTSKNEEESCEEEK